MESEYEVVLKYWFDGDQKLICKLKWFPSDNVQQHADLEIYTKFNALLNLGLQGKLDHWLQLNIKAALAFIIVLDQFSRHIFRYLNVPVNDSRRKFADELALQGTEFLIKTDGGQNSLSSTELIFALMPFRHTPTESRLQYVMTLVYAKESLELERMDLLNKFRKQTLTRLQHLQDRAKADDCDEILERAEFYSDNTDMPFHSLTESTLKFLCSTQIYTQDSNMVRSTFIGAAKPVVISLSGGVDSMVILRILIHLRDMNVIAINPIVAVHIDYANRAESGKEADFVEEYCRKYDVIFDKRVVNEVTRGITDRDEYERVSREIRYSFYDYTLKKYNCQGVIFGHHLGDVQENVISNVMRGCSPLHLSGMTEVGVVNGVNVWRPLLNYNKDVIFEFAHKYGVPYFKDTTPSWSTRGKLRRMLVPLLTDMYGSGCLRNLSNLAMASDELKDVMDQNVFSPFLNSVRQRACGLVVNVVNYRDRPVSFWKEMLKELMHSLSMSLVREKAVHSFIDRLNPLPSYVAQYKKKHALNCDQNQINESKLSNQQQIVIMSGWIELRKNFFSYLTVSGELIIFKDGVLVNDVDRNPSSERSGERSNIHENSTIKISKKKLKKLAYQAAGAQQRRGQQNKVNNDKIKGECRHIKTSDNDNLELERVMEELDGFTLGDMFEASSKVNIITIANNDSSVVELTDKAAKQLHDECATLSSTVDEPIVSETSQRNDYLPQRHSSADESQSQSLSRIDDVWPENFRISLSDLLQCPLACQDTATLGCWLLRLTIEEIDAKISDSLCESDMQIISPLQILSGNFSYTFDVSFDNTSRIDLVVYSQYKEIAQNQSAVGGGGGDYEEEEEEMIAISCLRHIDIRLRSSLPLLVPLRTSYTNDSMESSTAVSRELNHTKLSRIKIVYSYMSKS